MENNITDAELKEIEEKALENLKEEVKEILKDKDKDETLEFVLSKLSVKSLGELVSN